MSRPRYFWFGYIQNILRRYPDRLKADGTMQSIIAESAVRKALKDTYKKPDGAERVRMIEMVYFKQSHTLIGAALNLHISESTAKRWNRDFVYCVAGKMGFL